MIIKETATKNHSGNWSYKGVTIWRSDFSDGVYHSPSTVRWELTNEADNCSIEGTFDTLRAAKRFVDEVVENTAILSFEFTVDYLTVGSKITEDLEKRFRDSWQGSGCGIHAPGFDVSFENKDSRILSKIKTYVEKVYSDVIDSRLTDFYSAGYVARYAS